MSNLDLQKLENYHEFPGPVVMVIMDGMGIGKGDEGGGMLLAGLLFGLVAALGVWLFHGFLRLADWKVSPELPLGLKLLGHLCRALGSLAAGACLALAVLALVVPASVPPHPMKVVDGKCERIADDDPALGASRPALAATYVLGFFACLLVRTLGTSVAEMRRWARLGGLVVFGAAVALFTVVLVLNLTRWGFSTATPYLAVLDGLSALVFVFLLIYFMLPDTLEAFEAHGL